MSARPVQAIRLVARHPDPERADRAIHNWRGGWRIVATPRPSHATHLPCPPDCAHWRWNRLAIALASLLGLIAIAVFIATH